MIAHIIPQLSVRDVDAYAAFLSEALGFDLRERWVDPNDPSHVNVEMGVGDAVVGLNVARDDNEVTNGRIGLYVVVDDVDALYERATQAGANTAPPEGQPWGHRTFEVVDPEGFNWWFASPIER